MIWTLLILFAVISLPLGTWSATSSVPVYPADGLWQYLFIIYCLYLILPVNFFMTLVFGIVLSAIHVAVVLIRLRDSDMIGDSWPQVQYDQ